MNAQEEKEVAKLRAALEAAKADGAALEKVYRAAVKTLNANGHLADGAQCTLFDLREAVATYIKTSP